MLSLSTLQDTYTQYTATLPIAYLDETWQPIAQSLTMLAPMETLDLSQPAFISMTAGAEGHRDIKPEGSSLKANSFTLDWRTKRQGGRTLGLRLTSLDTNDALYTTFGKIITWKPLKTLLSQHRFRGTADLLMWEVLDVLFTKDGILFISPLNFGPHTSYQHHLPSHPNAFCLALTPGENTGHNRISTYQAKQNLARLASYYCSMLPSPNITWLAQP